MPNVSRKFLRRTWVRRALPAGVAAVLVVAGTVVTRANASASPLDTYRTTTVTTGSVEQRLNLTGSVQKVDQVSESFPVAGTVSGVSVSVGDTVTTGQTLSTIDPLPLQRAVTGSQATLAKAKATLESDQTTTTPASGTGGTGGTGGTSGTSGTGGTGGTSGTSGTSGTGGTSATGATKATPTISPRVTSPSGRPGGGSDPSLARAKQRVSDAQRAITTDLGQASAALTQCAPFFPSGPSPTRPAPTTSSTAPTTTAPATTAPPTNSPSSTSSPTPTEMSTTPSGPSDAAITACLGALRTAPKQRQIQRDQRALTQSQNALMTAVTIAITTASTATTTGATRTTSTAKAPAATCQSSAGRSTSTNAATSLTPTNVAASSLTAATSSRSSSTQLSGGSASTSQSAAQSGGAGQSGASRVVSDQAAVTTAQNTLSSAQTDLTTATLKSSIAGKVGSISLVNGASSSGKSVVIVGAGAVEVTVNVPLASIASMRVGQKATVTPQGALATSSVPGAVISISLLPSTSTSGGSAGGTAAQATTSGQGPAASGSPVYPVVILVPHTLPALASGSRADVSVLIGTAAMVLTVPNSALTPLGNGQALALTLKNGVATRAVVKTGYAGTLLTQITSGLTAGQHVVLADLSTALPTNTTNARRFGVAGGSGSGLGGAGLGGAGLGGAGLGGAGLGGAGIGGAGPGGSGFPRG